MLWPYSRGSMKLEMISSSVRNRPITIRVVPHPSDIARLSEIGNVTAR